MLRFCLALVLSLALSQAAFAFEASRHTASAGGNLTAVGVADSSWLTSGQTASALFSTGSDWIQVYLGIYNTKVNFDFAVGGAYKFTVAGTRSTGFHIGPGFALGTVDDEFAFAIFGAAGGHFTLADHFLLSVDAGPMITHTKNNTNFRLRPVGNLLGLSLFYVF
jgi:hypothetical protein